MNQENIPLITHKPCLALNGIIQYVKHALDLILVSINGARKLLWVKSREPGCLSVVWPLSRHLEIHPLRYVVLLWAFSKSQCLGLIVPTKQWQMSGTWSCNTFYG